MPGVDIWNGGSMVERKKSVTWDEMYDQELKLLRLRRDIEEPVQEHLVGLALSGGGIRSATFAVGVLESLKNSGLLKQIDYLSSVSGGGFAAGWLEANCKRAAQTTAMPNQAADPVDAPASASWLDPKTDWADSVRHLRRYSNYLSPQLGFFSADTWVMGTIWLRNMLLVQLTLILVFAAVLLLPRPMFVLFEHWSDAGNFRWLTVVLFVTAIVGIAGNLLRLGKTGKVTFLHSSSWGIGLLAAGFCFALVIAAIVEGHLTPFTNDVVGIGIIFVAPLLVLAVSSFCRPESGYFPVSGLAPIRRKRSTTRKDGCKQQ